MLINSTLIMYENAVTAITENKIYIIYTVHQLQNSHSG